jgi:hypothetical protein
MDEQTMHPAPNQNPGLMQVAAQAQNMAKTAQQEKMAIAFQTVAMVSMAMMSLTSAVHLVRDLVRFKGQSRDR